jgi:hypothetical protein
MKQVDILGFEIAADDYVCGNYGSNELGIFRVERLTEKMMILIHYKADTGFQRRKPRQHRRYARDMIKLSSDQVKALEVKIDEHEKSMLINTLKR